MILLVSWTVVGVCLALLALLWAVDALFPEREAG